MSENEVINKKVLIYNTFRLEARKGGPSTYLYNFEKYIQENRLSGFVTFLNGFDEDAAPPKLSGLRSIVKRLINRKKLANIQGNRHFNYLRNVQPLITKDYLNQFDIIHYHTVFDLFVSRQLLEGFKGKVVLTSHAPVAPHLEYLNEALHLEKKQVSTRLFQKWEGIDKYAFERADHLLFPVEGAVEPYLNSWPSFSEIMKKSRLNYVSTGIPKASFNTAPDVIRKTYNIPSDAFVVSYIGRHNSIKGYDLLKEFGQQILQKYENVYFLIAGKESPLTGLNSPRWIEVGWTNDPHSVVNASDLFVLPNRETYFDLVLLEVLSLSKPVLLSYTGGNKHFSKYDNEKFGFNFFEGGNVESMVEQFDTIYPEKQHIFSRGINNGTLFQQEYCLEYFGRNLLNFYNSL